jgi:hypothetical protein
MSQKVVTTFTLLIFILLMILFLWALTNYYAELTQHVSRIEEALFYL